MANKKETDVKPIVALSMKKAQGERKVKEYREKKKKEGEGKMKAKVDVKVAKLKTNVEAKK